MSTSISDCLEKAWAIMAQQLTDRDLIQLKKKFKEQETKLNVIHQTYQKINTLKALPSDSEDIAKLVIGILLAEAIQANLAIPPEKQKNIFEVILTSLKNNNELIKHHSKSSNRLRSTLKIILGLATTTTALWFTGPYCALAARTLFSVGYFALHGQPGWVVHYSYFVPAQEWVGNLAFNYGPKVLCVPTLAISSKTIDSAIDTLSRAQKILTFAYPYQLAAHQKEQLESIVPCLKNTLTCYL